MGIKPLVGAFSYPDNSLIPDSDIFLADALNYFLKTECIVEIREKDINNWPFEKESILNLIKHKLLIAIIISAGENLTRDDGYDDASAVSELIDDCPKDFPIIVVTYHRYQSRCCIENFKRNGVKALVYNHDNEDLLSLIKNLAQSWQPPQNWLGAATTADQDLLFRQLKNAYTYNQENLCGTPDVNHMVVAEALRIKMLPASCLAGEFDASLEEVMLIEKLSSLTFTKDLDALEHLPADEKKSFVREINLSLGFDSDDGCSGHQFQSNCCKNVTGFAIDPLTREHLITVKFGQHYRAGELLAKRIEIVENSYRQRITGGNRLTEYEIKSRLITGLIFRDILKFKTPVLQIWENNSTPKQFAEIVAYLKKQKTYLVINGAYELL